MDKVFLNKFTGELATGRLVIGTPLFTKQGPKTTDEYCVSLDIDAPPMGYLLEVGLEKLYFFNRDFVEKDFIDLGEL